jgi:CubicO group peptidase (beta-lactamase class C family)
MFALTALIPIALLLAVGPKDIEDRLQPPVQIEGHAPVKFRLADRMKFHHVPAVSVAVIQNGKLQWAQAWGTLEAGGTRAADANTMFQAASISKPVAALAALHMAQNGNFHLDDDVNTILKTWKVPAFSFPGKVTLRELLSHTAGLTVHGFGGYAEGDPVPTVPQVLDGAKPANSEPVRVDVAPGTIWRYSGGGYTVMQQMLIDKSGMSFPDLMQQMVLKRIGMAHSAYSQPLAAQYLDNAARAHLRDGKMIKGRWHTYPEMAAAGLWTTPSDLSLYLVEVWKASRGESNRVIEKAMAQEMLRVQKGNYGLGLGVEGEGAGRWFGHGGSNEGFRCDMRLYTESGDGIAVMTNGDDGSALAREIERAAADVYGWAGLKPQVKQAMTLPAAKLQRLTGTYAVGGTRIVVAVDRGALTAAFDGSADKIELLAESETDFHPMSDGLPKFKFLVSPNGHVDEIEFPGAKAQRVQP